MIRLESGLNFNTKSFTLTGYEVKTSSANFGLSWCLFSFWMLKIEYLIIFLIFLSTPCKTAFIKGPLSGHSLWITPGRSQSRVTGIEFWYMIYRPPWLTMRECVTLLEVPDWSMLFQVIWKNVLVVLFDKSNLIFISVYYILPCQQTIDQKIFLENQ